MTRATYIATALCGAALLFLLGFTAGHALGAAHATRAADPVPLPAPPTPDAGTMSGPAAEVEVRPPAPPVLAATLPAGVAAGHVDCEPTAATWLARIAVGEVDSVLATGEPTRDHVAILQTARNVARGTGQSLGEALRDLAPRLHGDRPVSSERQRWVRSLPACGDGPPSDGWTDCRDVSAGERCDGDWRRYRDGWARFRAWAASAIEEPADACPGEPIAYGCSDCETHGGCCDDAFALRRGLCRLDCGERLGFWARPGEGCL